MRLDARLRAVADLVPPDARTADVGADHAYLAIALVKERGVKSVIVSDKNTGPLEAARRAIHEAGLSEKIESRLGDGLAPFSPGEIDTICIAGMGGALITSILAASFDVLEKVETLVLQPMGDASILRRWLYEEGWHIEKESLAVSGSLRDEARVYEILMARRGRAPVPDEVSCLLGPILRLERPPLFPRHVSAILSRLSRSLSGMERSERARRSEKYFKLQKIILKLEMEILS